jgi:plastocyanin
MENIYSKRISLSVLLLMAAMIFVIPTNAAPETAPLMSKSGVDVTEPQNASSNQTSAQNVTVDLAARNIKFDKSTITVPAGAHVTMNFDNQESVPHNFALYENSNAQNVIFKGEVISGPKVIVYDFDAPEEPGTYFFRCDVHPRTMTGEFVVT